MCMNNASRGGHKLSRDVDYAAHIVHRSSNALRLGLTYCPELLDHSR